MFNLTPVITIAILLVTPPFPHTVFSQAKAVSVPPEPKELPTPPPKPAAIADSAAPTSDTIRDSAPQQDASAGQPVDAFRAAMPAPIAVRDTLARARKRDSLTAEILIRKQRYLRFPVSIDSVFSVYSVGPSQLLHNDAAGLSEAARRIPQIVYAPYSLANGLNRFMLYGFPLLPNAASLDNSAFPDGPTAISGNDNIFSTQLDAVSVSSPYGVSCAQGSGRLVIPHAVFLWETGAFSENLLGVRFARPLTQTIDIGIFSNYRYSAPFLYSTATDMSSLFSNFISDTSLAQNNGRNPLVNESRMSLWIGSHDGSRGASSLSYSYEDAKNDLAVQCYDTLTKAYTPAWEKITRFSNVLRTQTRSFHAGPLLLNADAKAAVEGHSADIPQANTRAPVEKKGRNTEFALCIEPFLALGADTLLVTGAGTVTNRRLYNQSNASASTGDIRAGYRRGFSFSAFSASVKASCGDGIIKPAGKATVHSFVYSTEASARMGMQNLRLYALRDHLPFALPYDTLKAEVRSYFDAYEAYGAELFLGYKKIGLTTGICAVTGVDTALAERYWPGNSMPYRQPGVSLMVAPLFGRFFGFALSSRLMLSDTKPYLKSQSTLSYEAHPLTGMEDITVELIYDYWSVRDPVSFGGISLWNRELNSLSLRTAVHIQAFNIYYKIDNVLNRKFAYVPGYFMPGITFRWGFQWLIQ
jgi:hypothetical protein